MRQISLIRLEWTCYNGFDFHILEIDTASFEGALFGVNFSEQFLHVQLLFYHFDIKSPFL